MLHANVHCGISAARYSLVCVHMEAYEAKEEDLQRGPAIPPLNREGLSYQMKKIKK